MELREGDNFLEVRHIEANPEGHPAAGDVCVFVQAHSDGFAGVAGEVWIHPASMQHFVRDLRQLEAMRHGSARLESLGYEDEFWLEFRSIDRAGHMAVFGKLRRLQFLRSGGGHCYQS